MEKRQRILNVLTSVSEDVFTPGDDESLFASGILDSFALTDFVVGLEKEFAVKIPDADMTARKFDTIRKVEEYLAGKGV
jgi:acyl carrier protein